MRSLILGAIFLSSFSYAKPTGIWCPVDHPANDHLYLEVTFPTQPADPYKVDVVDTTKFPNFETVITFDGHGKMSRRGVIEGDLELRDVGGPTVQGRVEIAEPEDDSSNPAWGAITIGADSYPVRYCNFSPS